MFKKKRNTCSICQGANPYSPESVKEAAGGILGAVAEAAAQEQAGTVGGSAVPIPRTSMAASNALGRLWKNVGVNFNATISPGEHGDDCGVGWYFDANTGRCVPNTGRMSGPCPECGQDHGQVGAAAMGSQGKKMSMAPFGKLPQAQPGIVLPSGRQAPPHQPQKSNIKGKAPAPSDASKLKEFANDVASHLNARQATKFGIPVTAQDLWNWFSFDKKWSSYLDVYAAYPVPGQTGKGSNTVNMPWDRAILKVTPGDWHGSCGMYWHTFMDAQWCDSLKPTLFDMAWRLCSMKAADDYMASYASAQPKLNLPAFGITQTSDVVSKNPQGRLGVIAQYMRDRLNAAKATTMGVPDTDAVLFRWMVEQKGWNSYHDMYEQYGNWESWVTQMADSGVTAFKKNTTGTGRSGNEQAQRTINKMADSWYNDLIYPLCIEQAVDEFIGYAANFKQSGQVSGPCAECGQYHE